MKEFFSKNRKLVMIIASAVLAVLGLVFILCGCLIGGGKSRLSVPQNLKLVDDLLSWDEVENAEKGYTVKIGADESTTVTEASLNLTTVKAKLKEGENKLSVKANATEAFDASAYSDEVTYVYRTPFATPANLSINTETGVLSWAPVSGATAYIVSVVGGTQQKEVTTASINLVQFDLEKDAKVKFAVKAKASGYKLESAAAESEEYTVPDYAALLLTEIGKFDTIIDNEELIKEFDKFVEDVYNFYPDKIKNDSSVKTAYDALNAKYDKAKTDIEYDVMQLVVGIDGMLKNNYDSGTDETTLRTAYNTFYEKLKTIEALGEYATQCLNKQGPGITVAIEKKMAQILTIPVKTEVEHSTLVQNHKGDVGNGYLYVMCTFENVEGEALTGTNIQLPILTAKLDGVDLDAANITAPALANKDGVFVWEIDLGVSLGADAKTVTYKVGGQEEKTLTFALGNTNIWEPKISNENKLTFGGGTDGKNYIDVYKQGDADTYDGAERNITISGKPLACEITVSANMSEDELRAALVTAGIEGENLKLTLVFYSMEKNGNTFTYSNVNSKSLMNYDCSLSQEDLKTRLNFTDVALSFGSTADVMEHGGGGLSQTFLTGLVQQFNDNGGSGVTANDLKDLIVYYFDVTYGGKTATFKFKPDSFTIGAEDGAGNVKINAKLIFAEFYKEFGAVDNGRLEIRVGIDLSDEANTTYGGKLRKSLPLGQFDGNYSLGNVKLLNSWALNEKQDEGEHKNCIGYQWELINNNKPYTDKAEIRIYRVEGGSYSESTYLTSYIYNAKNEQDEYAVGFIQWDAINTVLVKAWGALSDKTKTEKFVFAIRALVNDEGRTSGYVDSDLVYMKNGDAIVQKEYTQDWHTPTDPQLYFKEQDGEGQETQKVICVAQIRDGFNIAKNGEVFLSGGTDHVEVKFTKTGSSTLTAYLFAEGDDLKLYKTLDDAQNKTDAQTCAVVTNGWLNVSDLSNKLSDWFKTELGLAEDAKMDLKDGWAIQTKVIVNNTGYYTGFPTENSSGWSEAQTWVNRLNVTTVTP